MELYYGLFVLLFLTVGSATVVVKLRRQQQLIGQLTAQLAQLTYERDLIINALTPDDQKRLQRELMRPRAVAKPPRGLVPVLKRLQANPDLKDDPLAFILGWYVTGTSTEPSAVSLSLSGASTYRSGNMIITGESGHGKGTLGHAILLQLAHRAAPTTLRLQIIDPKQSDGELWRGKAHLWRDPVLGKNVEIIQAMMQQLRAEREARDALRGQHKVRDWHELPKEHRSPYLLVWITDFATVLDAVGDRWFEEELSMCRASGIIYVIDLQNQSGKEMSWRTHVHTFIAGFQSSRVHIQPNIGLSPQEIAELGGTLPTDLEMGQFTVRNKRDVATISVPFLETVDIRTALAPLPEASAPTPKATAVTNASTTVAPMQEPASSPQKPQAEVAPELREQIIQAARAEIQERGGKASRTNVYKRVYNAPVNNDRYQLVKRVLDEAELLLPVTREPVNLEIAAAQNP